MEMNIKRKNISSDVSDTIPSNYGVEVIYLAFSNEEIIEQIRRAYLWYNSLEDEYEPFSYSTTATFNVTSNEAEVENALSEIAESRSLSVATLESIRKEMYNLYGGLFFIGLVVSAVLLIGTTLMLYFKQITEGYEDKENYRIMKQVGLPDSLIEKTINSQIIWIFFLPIAVAIIHNIFASKIMYMLIGMFGQRDLTTFTTSYVGVLVVFALIYLIFYQSDFESLLQYYQ